MRVVFLVLTTVALAAATACVRREDMTKAESVSPSASASSSAAGMFQHHGAVEVHTPNGPMRFVVELALENAELARGLMERTQLADDAGMLFIFPQQRIQSFWMKNTFIPLDMIFIEEGGVIAGIVESAEPLTLTSRSVGRPSRYVLEVNGGTAARLGISPGMRVRFEGVPAERVDPNVLGRPAQAPSTSPGIPSAPPSGDRAP